MHIFEFVTYDLDHKKCKYVGYVLCGMFHIEVPTLKGNMSETDSVISNFCAVYNLMNFKFSQSKRAKFQI
jgi:hypothetical protein